MFSLISKGLSEQRDFYKFLLIKRSFYNTIRILTALNQATLIYIELYYYFLINKHLTKIFYANHGKIVGDTMLEIRWHGRGGQGVWSGTAVLALAAIKAGKFAQSFPEFGPERRGAPVNGYNRIDDKPIKIHCGIYEPDAIIVIDPTLLKYREMILSGLKRGGKIVINSEKKPEKLREELKVGKDVEIWVADATSIALEEVKRPSTNTATLGVLLRAIPVVPMDKLAEAIISRWPGDIGEKNVKAIKRAYEEAMSG
jgi:2-oxoacid:acceptor oxidoreductase gamma subunit (pyruvate/2-ketoisovalerate family)